jgi:acid phosphatase/tartrate-resistant acid phosphatase type 5
MKQRLMLGMIILTVATAGIGLYAYTHQSLHRIPSDFGNVDNITFFALGDQGSGGLKQWVTCPQPAYQFIVRKSECKVN